MGSQPWMYVVPYQSNIQKALDDLKEREFRAGRYYPAIDNSRVGYVHPENMIGPGAQHSSIDEAVEASGDMGTQSILDMVTVGTRPNFQVIVPLEPDTLEAVFGTTTPTRAMIDQSEEWLEDIGRGEGVYMLLYENGTPTEILFAGYSFD